MKTRKELKRTNMVKCYLNDEEMQKLTELRLQLDVTISDLLRSRLLLNISPSKLLLLLNEIGLDISSINTRLKKYFQDCNAQQENNSAPEIEGIIESYLSQQHRLELEIRKLLIRIEKRK